MSAQKIVLIVFASMFLVFFLTGFIGMTITGNFIAGCEETTGVITRIEGGERAYAAYTAGGAMYENRLDAHTSNMRVGGEIKIFYDPSNPNSIATDELMLVWFIMRCVGYGCIVVGVIIYLICKSSEERRALLIDTGRRIPCEITGVKIIKSVSFGKLHPYQIVCRSQASGSTKQYVSPYLWKNPEPVMKRTVDVCVDERNEKRYAVDIKSCGLDESYLTAK